MWNARLAATWLVATVCAGCAAPTRLPEPVLCLSRAQCDAMWSRAQLFVATKSGFRIEVATESLIRTYGPDVSPRLAMTITRELAPDGSGVIRFLPMCGSPFACVPEPTPAGRDFFAYLAAVPER